MSIATTADTNAHSVDPSTVTAVGTSSGEPSKLAASTTTTTTTTTRAPDAGAGTAKEAVVGEKSAATGADTPTKVKRRKGFWAQFVGACVPCISAEGHDTTPDAGLGGGHGTAIARSRLAPSEQSSLDQKEKDKNRRSSILPVDASISTTLDAAGNALADSVTTGPARDPTPEPHDDMDQDADVVVPPNANAHHTLPDDETAGVTAGAVQAPGQTETDIAEDMDEEEDRLILNGGMGIPIGPDGQPQPLLPKLLPEHEGRKCLVLDLDETLVHSSFRMIPQADYVIPVLIEHQLHNVYVVKRPGVDLFLEKMGELYEVVVFTASLSMYADPVLDKLDVHKAVTHRLFREHCYNHKGVYVKDLSQLGRPIEGTIILDNSPASYIFHPNNAVPVSSWFSDPHDTELTDMCPFLDDLRHVEDVRGVLDGGL